MEKYTNEAYLKKEIMEQSRHHFIYSYKGDKRTNFLKQLEKDYPVKMDESSPMGIYLEDYGLPDLSIKNKELDRNRQQIIADSYLSLSLISKILKEMILQDKENQLEERMQKLLSFVNRCCKLKKVPDVNNSKELLDVLEESKRLFKEFYCHKSKGGSVNDIYDIIPIPFVDSESFIQKYKEILENDSYFGILIDHNKPIAVYSTRAINQLVGSRINNNISMKVATNLEEWQSHMTLNGQYIEATHDYGVVELDDSYKNYKR